MINEHCLRSHFPKISHVPNVHFKYFVSPLIETKALVFIFDTVLFFVYTT